MKLKTLGFLLAIGAATAAASPAKRAPARSGVSCPVLWQGVRAGMSVTQLRAVLPNVRDSGNGSLVAPNTTVVGEPFEVYIELLDGRVADVILAGKALPSSVADALTAKYGPAAKPYACRMMGDIYLCAGEWLKGGVKVSLSRMVTEGSGSSTRIKYAAADIGNL